MIPDNLTVTRLTALTMENQKKNNVPVKSNGDVPCSGNMEKHFFLVVDTILKPESLKNKQEVKLSHFKPHAAIDNNVKRKCANLSTIYIVGHVCI